MSHRGRTRSPSGPSALAWALWTLSIGLSVGQQCPLPAVPLNSRVSLSSSTPGVGATATYSCDDGYELFGSISLPCVQQGSRAVWQGDLPFCGTNVAYRKPANQSSSMRGGAAPNAVDGDKEVIHDGKRCTETGREPSPWWRVDLLREYPVRAVRLTSRGCCGHQLLQDLEIRVGNSSDLQRNPLCAWYPGTIDEGTTKIFTCARPIVGRHVAVQMVGVEGSLSLCEVEVFTTDEFSNERCVPSGVVQEGSESAVFSRTCYEFHTTKGASYEQARASCRRVPGGDLLHAPGTAHNGFVLSELERRKPKLKTQLVWLGATRDPGYTSRTWRWVNGEAVGKPVWGKDQPNNYNGEQNCVVLDGGRGWQWNDVGCNLDYLHWVCQHQPAACGSPDRNLNTSIAGGDHVVGKSITYSCPEGHMLVGNATRECLNTGFWSGVAPTCKYVDCGSIKAPEHGSVQMLSGRTTHGALAEVTCESNYTLKGDAKKKCGDEGVWSGEEPQCLFAWCPEPPEVAGGRVEMTGRKAGSTATYKCQAGFILLGEAVLTCGLGGTWSGRAPECRFVDCGAPANTFHGRVELLNATTTAGSVARYECEADYWLEGDSIITCGLDGKWSAHTPSCELITCEEPEVPNGGFVIGYDFNVHSRIEYHCEPGHLLRGEPTRECNSNGEWSSRAPSCQYVDCGKFSPVPYGSVKLLNDTTYVNSEVEFSCVRNYRLSGGQAHRVCQEDGSWSGSTPRCEEIRCPEPVLAEHAILSVTGNDRAYGRTLIRTAAESNANSAATYKISAQAKYRCERGYRLIGEGLRTCEESGIWSGGVPQCEYVDCGQPEEIPFGRVNLASNATYYGVVALYDCVKNYKIEGYERRMCLENGSWSHAPPVCSEILCPSPTQDNGLIAQVSSYSVGGVARYFCPRGYNMEGNDTRVCLQGGTWSGYMPACRAVDCGHPGIVENGRVVLPNQTTIYLSPVEYHCIPQYKLVGQYLRRCKEDGSWSGDEPTCEQASLADSAASQQMGLIIGICAGVLLFLLLLLGVFYMRLRRPTLVKNSENVQGAEVKEETRAAVMSYATLSDPYNRGPNIYENIAGETNTYDTPYETAGRRDSGDSGHYEPSPTPTRVESTVTINGVAIR
ncbi:Hypothetical predicted protein [Cloeon dipterum]|uniref:Sushi, von Willebrand factor type A, EGF and pentraxin domain-containing protein 1 n=2 Tax=Cloeon dipterum TaxID=197152 RepID=A0A8S1DSS0_9INSE|nr:Hypothetical predicted protein [Cloeon dipterum]